MTSSISPPSSPSLDGAPESSQGAKLGPRSIDVDALESLIERVSTDISERLASQIPTKTVGSRSAFLSKDVTIPLVDLTQLIPSPIVPAVAAASVIATSPTTSTEAEATAPAPRSDIAPLQPTVSTTIETAPSENTAVHTEAVSTVFSDANAPVHDAIKPRKGRVSDSKVVHSTGGTVTSDSLDFHDESKIQERYKKRQKSLEDILNQDKKRKSSSI